MYRSLGLLQTLVPGALCWENVKVITHMSGDVGSDLSQDVLAVYELDTDGYYKKL